MNYIEEYRKRAGHCCAREGSSACRTYIETVANMFSQIANNDNFLKDTFPELYNAIFREYYQ